MESAAQSIKMDPERIDAGDPGRFLDLPNLGHQRSLRDLIEDDLHSRDDESIEMANLLLRTDEHADSDCNTAAAPFPQALDGGDGLGDRPGKLLNPANDDSNSRSTEGKSSKGINTSPRRTFWQRLSGRQRTTFEQPKIVYSYKRRNTLREFLLFHFLPVSINFALLGLYTQQVLWIPPQPTTNSLNALQFAAKVHETLMVVSLANILLHHIRYRLLSSTIPLGLATSPFRLLDLTYLWSQEFSAAWWGEKGISSSDVISVFIHVFLFILAAILGPASAISMLPRLGEWNTVTRIADAPFNSTSLQIYMGAELSDIYPSRITGSLAPKACDYSDFSQPQSNECPRYGLEDILQGWLPNSFGFENKSWVRWDIDNITVQTNINSEVQPRTITVSTVMHSRPAEGVQTSVDVTTASDVILRFAKSLVNHYLSEKTPWVMGDDSSGIIRDYLAPVTFKLYPGQSRVRQLPSSWKQPFVSSFCSPRGITQSLSGPTSFKFFRGGWLGPTDMNDPEYTITLDSDLLPATSENIEMDFINISNLDIKPNFTPSAAFIYTYQSNVTLCLVKAAWVDLALSITQHWKGDFPQDISWTWGVPASYNGSRYRTSNFPDGTNATDTIHLGLDWLKILDYGIATDRKSDHRFFKRFSQACLDRSAVNGSIPNQVGLDLDATCMAGGLALGITEGLSKVANHFNLHALGSVEDFEGKHYGPSMTLSPWTNPDIQPTPNGFVEGIFHANWTPSNFSPYEIKDAGTRLDFVITETVYGYGFHDVTITMAFVVLFMYVGTVFSHIIITSLGTSWSSRAWMSLGEYLVLAVQSPIPTSVLDNTGGGVRKLSTWKSRVSVQELQGGKELGFIVKEPGRSDTENALEQGSRVRPDCEY